MNPKEQQINIDITQTTEVLCNECGHNVFTQGVMIRKLSAILSPNGQESLIPIPVFECSKCGGVNKEFLPKLEA